MTASSSILQLATQLADPSSRRLAADDLARVLGGSSLLVFIRDIEVNQLLTVPGLPQTLPDGAEWRRFLQRCVDVGEQRGELRLQSGHDKMPVYGFAVSTDVAFVLAGTHQPNPEIADFKAMLPLLAAALRGEQQARAASTQADLAITEALKAEALTRALDTANAKMRKHGAALAEANLELQQQTEVLQQQTVELEVQAEELERANGELEIARSAAVQASTAKSDFLSVMSHELRTPLNAISGYVQLMQLGIHGPLTDPQREALDRVAKSQRHLLTLINEILSLARIESGVVDYDIADVSADALVAEVLPLVEPQMAEKQLKLEVALPADPLWLRADQEKMNQILLNLLSNALKFTPAGKSITISGGALDATSGYISISDTGIGIPPDHIESIFEPFVQVQKGLTRTVEGTGLGLSISRDLARGMQGNLTATSKEGEGSTLTLTLPLSEKSTRPDRPLKALFTSSRN